MFLCRLRRCKHHDKEVANNPILPRNHKRTQFSYKILFLFKYESGNWLHKSELKRKINQVNERNHIWKDKNTRLDHQAQHHGGKGSLWNRHNIAELDGKNPSLTA